MGFSQKISPSQALLLTISAKVQICLLYPLGHNPSATDDLTKICQDWWWVLSNYRTKLSDVWSEDDCLRLIWCRQWSIYLHCKLHYNYIVNCNFIVVPRAYWGKLSCSLHHSSHLIATLLKQLTLLEVIWYINILSLTFLESVWVSTIDDKESRITLSNFNINFPGAWQLSQYIRY